MATRISVTVNDAVTQSAAKLGVQLKEKQREALLEFCLGKDVCISSNGIWKVNDLCQIKIDKICRLLRTKKV